MFVYFIQVDSGAVMLMHEHDDDGESIGAESAVTDVDVISPQSPSEDETSTTRPAGSTNVIASKVICKSKKGKCDSEEQLLLSSIACMNEASQSLNSQVLCNQRTRRH